MVGTKEKDGIKEPGVLEKVNGLQQFLSTAAVVESRDLGRGGTRPRLVVLKGNGQICRAVFKTVELDVDRSDRSDQPDRSDEPDRSDRGGSDRYQHEVAAYRLDRRLGLNMVPVTVIRKIEDHTGSLQAWIESAVDQDSAQTYGLSLYDTGAARRQRLGGT